MGILDKARDAAIDALTPGPIKDVKAALTAPPPQAPPDAAQTQYEAREREMNRNNPHYQNVDNSGLTKEPLGGK